MNKKILWFVKLIIGLVLLYLIYQQVNKRNDVIHAFQSASWLNIVICFVLLIPNLILQIWKWRFVLHTRFENIQMGLAAKSLLFGATLGFITPGHLGDLARAISIKDYNKLVVSGLNLVDKFSGIIIFLTTGLGSVNYIMLTKLDWPGRIQWPFLVLSVFILTIIWIFALNPIWIRSIALKVRWKTSWQLKIENITSALNGLHRSTSLKILGLAFLWFIIILLQYHVLVLAFENVPLLHSFWAVSATLFTKVLLPISFGDLGIREGAALYYYSLFGVSHATAFNAALLIFLINFVIPATLGSYFVFRLRLEE
jgi:uncharacterized protein (TIRG00374 family)